MNTDFFGEGHSFLNDFKPQIIDATDVNNLIQNGKVFGVVVYLNHAHAQLTYVFLVSCMIDLHSTTQVVSRLHATVLGKSCVVQIGPIGNEFVVHDFYFSDSKICLREHSRNTQVFSQQFLIIRPRRSMPVRK
jgi:hypothetical protein